jgi:hypothetical protein
MHAVRRTAAPRLGGLDSRGTRVIPKVHRAWRPALAFLNTPLGLIAAGFVCTGVLSGIITTRLEEAAKRRELAQTFGKEMLIARLATVSDVYKKLATTIQATVDLMQTRDQKFDSHGLPPDKEEKLKAQVTQMRETFNSANATWQSDRIVARLLLGYYHHGGRVLQRWDALDANMERYLECARHWDSGTGYVDRTDQVCRIERQHLETALDSLSATLQAENDQSYRSLR